MNVIVIINKIYYILDEACTANEYSPGPITYQQRPVWQHFFTQVSLMLREEWPAETSLSCKRR